MMYERKKMKLSLVFLPFSPFILMILSGNKWYRLHRMGFHKAWLQYLVLMIVSVFLAQIPPAAFILWLAITTQSRLAVAIALYGYGILTSLVIREVDYRRMTKLPPPL